jgi:hypothetical protein
MKPSTLQELSSDIADTLVKIDSSKIPFRGFKLGVGPYGEPQLVKEIVRILDKGDYWGLVKTKRTPDLLIKNSWAIEFKIIRSFGDNGKPAENWSINLLHPYEGNVSALGDCLKLLTKSPTLRKAVIAICYEHTPPKISLQPLLDSFEILADRIMNVNLSPRVVEQRVGLIHPVHQQLSIVAWEVLGYKEKNKNIF